MKFEGIDMSFKTIEEYDDELREMESRLDGMEERIKEHPERKGIALNYKSFKQLYDIVSNDREEYLRMVEENTDFHVSNDGNRDFSLPLMSEIVGCINSFTFSVADWLKRARNLECDLFFPVVKVSSGSLHLSFSMGDEKTDLREVRLNQDLFNTLFDVFECSDEDIPGLRKRLDGKSLASYRDFLNMLIKHNLDITLENSSRSVSLTHEDALEVYNLLSK